MVALGADCSIEEQTLIDAFTEVAGWIIGSSDAATLTVEGGFIVKGAGLALGASLPVEERFFGGTEDAGVLIEIVNCMSRAGGALLCIEVEVFGQITLDALLFSEEGLVARTLATVFLFHVISATRTRLTGLGRHVEVKSLRTGLTAIIGEDGFIGGATLASLERWVI